MQKHIPLVLEVFRQQDILKMSLFEQSELASTIRHYSQNTVSLEEIKKLSDEIEFILDKTEKGEANSFNCYEDLKKTGQLLWDVLLTRQVKERLKNETSRELILSLDEELTNIPWELFYDGKDFLSLKFSLGRVLRTKEEKVRPQYRSFSSKLKMLILVNPTGDLKSAYSEGIYIRNKFDKYRNDVIIDFKSTNIESLYVRKNLRDYDIVHFAGHCEYDQDNPKKTGWVFKEGLFNTEDILLMAESTSLPSLIFSNACHSAQENSTSDTSAQNRNYSLASAFLFSGVRHYIGTIRKVEDPLSLFFAREFYSHLIKGESLGEALRRAKLRLIQEYGFTSFGWVSYLLYGDPSFILFRKRPPLPERINKKSLPQRKTLLNVSLVCLSLLVSAYLFVKIINFNPSAQLLLIQSKALFKTGRNEKVISLSHKIIQKDPLFLPAYPLLAEAYFRTGDTEKAIKYYFEHIVNSEKKQDKEGIALSYINLGWMYQQQGDYVKAYDFYVKAIEISKNNQDRLNEATALRKLAVWHIDKGNYDKALELLTKSSEINREKQHLREYRYNLACDYFDMGLVFSDKEDYNSAKEFYLKSAKLFEKLKLGGELSDYYFNLGEVCLFEKDYPKTLAYYEKGLKIDQAQGNMPNLASDYNMFGELYMEMGNLEKAEDYFNQSITISRKIKAPLELACGYHNLGLLYKEKGRKNQAREFLRSAQEIYAKLNPEAYEEIKQELINLTNK
jgi:tetratricopeptide (TPR) repeat protein